MSYIGINSMGKLILGTTKMAKAYLGTQLVYQSGGGPTPPTPVVEPVFYDYLVFDGAAYIQSSYVLPSGSSFRCIVGNETLKGAQRIFLSEGDGGYIGLSIGGGSNSTRRQVLPYYDSTSYLASNRYVNWSYTSIGLFLTQNRFGCGNATYTITKGSSHPTGGIIFGGGGSQPFTGRMQTFYVYGSETASVTTYAGFDSYTPIATFRPCTYNGVPGLWYVEGSTFFGNSAGAGTLTVSNS